MPEIVHVILESESTEAERTAVGKIFEDSGIRATVEGAYIRESAEVLPWLIQIEANLRQMFGYLLAGATGAAGAEGWTRLKDLVIRLYEARKGTPGDVTLKDPESRTEIPLPRGLPDEAYERLAEIENPRAPHSGILRWDRERQRWIDPLAGLLRCRYPSCGLAATEGRVRQLSATAMERREFCDTHAAAADLGDERAWA
jgi:hypothetical protein